MTTQDWKKFYDQAIKGFNNPPPTVLTLREEKELINKKLKETFKKELLELMKKHNVIFCEEGEETSSGFESNDFVLKSNEVLI